jgi:hypothetical protein
MGEDLGDDGRVLKGGDEAQSSAAVRAGQYGKPEARMLT